MTTNTTKKTINDLLEELDIFVENRLNQIRIEITREKHELRLNNFQNKRISSYSIIENKFNEKISELKKEIYTQLNNINNYITSETSESDYEKIAKVIAYTHDIIELMYYKNEPGEIFISISKLPKKIEQYFIPYKNYKDIKEHTTEGNHKFDAENSFVNYNQNNTSKIFVQATKSEDILKQTELIFKTSEKSENKKIYIISEEYPKKDLKYYFKIIDDELNERLEQLRFLILSSKIYQDEVFNKNKSLEYFFSIIYFSSKGFNNFFNKKMYRIYYDGEFDILKLMEDKVKKNSPTDIIDGIELYLEDTFRYFNNNLNIPSFYDDCHITGAMKNIINHLHILVNLYLHNNYQRNLLKENLNQIETYKYAFDKLPSENNEYNLTTDIENSLNIDLQFLLEKLNSNKQLNKPLDYLNFSEEIKNIIISELELVSVKDNFKHFKRLTDADILNITFYNYGHNFLNLMYEYKNSKNKNYDNIKLFKKFMLIRIISIIDQFNIQHVKIFYQIIANTTFTTDDMKYLLFEACANIAIGNVSKEYIDNLKIYLLSSIFYPQTLNNRFYPNITDFILKNSVDPKLNSTIYLTDIIDTYLKYIKHLNPVYFINSLHLSTYDSLQLFNILEKNNKGSKIRKYLAYKLQEFLFDGRLDTIREMCLKHRNYGKFIIKKIFPWGNTLQYQLLEKYYKQMITLDYLFFEVRMENNLIAIFYITINDSIKQPIFIYKNDEYTSDILLNDAFNNIILKNNNL
jgi:hypothetical protein